MFSLSFKKRLNFWQALCSCYQRNLQNNLFLKIDVLIEWIEKELPSKILMVMKETLELKYPSSSSQKFSWEIITAFLSTLVNFQWKFLNKDQGEKMFKQIHHFKVTRTAMSISCAASNIFV